MHNHEALYYKCDSHNDIQCTLCPHTCTITQGRYGICNMRKNQYGRLIAMTYGVASALATDPIEKKPLYHFYPGKNILSIGSYGCNLKCFFCQNCNISQSEVKSSGENYYAPTSLLEVAAGIHHNIGIAFTYNEPVVYYEYMLDTAKLFHFNNYNTVMVSNGYINPDPLDRIMPYIDAYNIDLKAFDDHFYKIHTKSRLQPVLNTIKTIHRNGKHIELTLLAIPGLNDDKSHFSSMLNWITDEIGKDCILHISRYFPQYKSSIKPTPVELLTELYEIASNKLDYVYMGNVSGSAGQDTFCPVCGELCISRKAYNTKSYLIDHGCCPKCNKQIISYI